MKENEKFGFGNLFIKNKKSRYLNYIININHMLSLNNLIIHFHRFRLKIFNYHIRFLKKVNLISLY